MNRKQVPGVFTKYVEELFSEVCEPRSDSREPETFFMTLTRSSLTARLGAKGLNNV
jgi:hypothetical protein